MAIRRELIFVFVAALIVAVESALLA